MYTSIKKILEAVETLETEVGYSLAKHTLESDLRRQFIQAAVYELDPAGFSLTHEDDMALWEIDSREEAKAILSRRHPDFTTKALHEMLIAVPLDTESLLGFYSYTEMESAFGSTLAESLTKAMAKRGMIIKGYFNGDTACYNAKNALQKLGHLLVRLGFDGEYECWTHLCKAQTGEDLAAAFDQMYKTKTKIFKNGKIKVQLPAAGPVAKAYADYIHYRNESYKTKNSEEK